MPVDGRGATYPPIFLFHVKVDIFFGLDDHRGPTGGRVAGVRGLAPVEGLHGWFRPHGSGRNPAKPPGVWAPRGDPTNLSDPSRTILNLFQLGSKAYSLG